MPEVELACPRARTCSLVPVNDAQIDGGDLIACPACGGRHGLRHATTIFYDDGAISDLRVEIGDPTSRRMTNRTPHR